MGRPVLPLPPFLHAHAAGLLVMVGICGKQIKPCSKKLDNSGGGYRAVEEGQTMI